MARARLHPLAILLALRTYAQGRGDRGGLTWEPVQPVLDALNAAFYTAFRAVEPTGKRLLLIHSLAGSWRSGNPILNDLAAEPGVGELGHEYEESPCKAPSVNQPIFLKTAIKKESRIISVSNLVVSSSMIMNPTPGNSQSVKFKCLKMYVKAIGLPTSVEC